ncbi:hypothetical protein KIN20_021221 [Parelaphostrongylus tenuis]|uniref:Uncharacterized protein n=1 Tax=Parelaphostrongylus tenuis TaxID=148309 RepID=A0AAD5QUD0_PARTN|nr:hypothetical protein KIN20_021221 [Parelaphostrongylus tenuis]
MNATKRIECKEFPDSHSNGAMVVCKQRWLFAVALSKQIFIMHGINKSRKDSRDASRISSSASHLDDSFAVKPLQTHLLAIHRTQVSELAGSELALCGCVLICAHLEWTELTVITLFMLITERKHTDGPWLQNHESVLSFTFFSAMSTDTAHFRSIE